MMAIADEIEVPAHGDLRFATGMVATEKVNVRGLERHLRRHIEGEWALILGGIVTGWNLSPRR